MSSTVDSGKFSLLYDMNVNSFYMDHPRTTDQQSQFLLPSHNFKFQEIYRSSCNYILFNGMCKPTSAFVSSKHWLCIAAGDRDGFYYSHYFCLHRSRSRFSRSCDNIRVMCDSNSIHSTNVMRFYKLDWSDNINRSHFIDRRHFLNTFYFRLKNPLSNIIAATVSAIIFMAWFAIDIQLIIGGRRREISAEDYIFATIQLFMDIMIIFWLVFIIVALVAASDGDCNCSGGGCGSCNCSCGCDTLSTQNKEKKNRDHEPVLVNSAPIIAQPRTE
ncbi:protein lifeguard 1 [Ditylenchus destructor]|nr:protein lifeguard 1 [Ditylenchus destructor]